MSFASDTRDELIRVPMDRDCCIAAELSALTQTSGSLSFVGGGRVTATWQLTNAALARRVFRMLKEGLGLQPSLHFVQGTRLAKRRLCVLTLDSESTGRLLELLQMAEMHDDGTVTLTRMSPKVSLTRQCCRRSFLRGAFLGAGSLTEPEKQYHLEWNCPDENLALGVMRQLEKNGISSGKRNRRGLTVVTLKSEQSIADALALMGAHRAVMQLENIRITREMRGRANRASNCDVHNTERVVEAGTVQAERIKIFSIEEGIFTLPPALQEIARLRLEHPELSLEELGLMCRPPVGKSGVNHRMRRLMQACDQMEKRMTLNDRHDDHSGSEWEQEGKVSRRSTEK